MVNKPTDARTPEVWAKRTVGDLKFYHKAKDLRDSRRSFADREFPIHLENDNTSICH